jgi:3-deoxy-D-manno-octulosonic-acid transferase
MRETFNQGLPTMLRGAYTILLYCALPFILLRLKLRARAQKAYGDRWAERFGCFNGAPKPGGIWIHTVSMGEAIAATPLIKALQQRYPDTAFTITTMTPTGSERVRKTFKDDVFHVYLPYDYPDAVKRFLKKIKPRMGIIMETELWPNLLAACDKQQIPVMLTNARLSEKSYQGYARIAPLARQMMQHLTSVATVGEPDAKRFAELGLDPQKIQTTGNIKFDINISNDVIVQGKQLRQSFGDRRPVWVAASTHPGEETIVLSAFEQLKQTIPNLLLMVVPRHPEEFDPVANKVKAAGWQLGRRSDMGSVTTDIDVFLGDSMGEMMMYYAASDIAFVGGSLITRGGHNVLEPIALGKPVLSGPHVFNFATICQSLQDADGLTIVNDASGLAGAVKRLLEDKTVADKQVEQANVIFNQNKGALAKQIEMAERLL